MHLLSFADLRKPTKLAEVISRIFFDFEADSAEGLAENRPRVHLQLLHSYRLDYWYKGRVYHHDHTTCINLYVEIIGEH